MDTGITDRLGACSHPGRERTENQDAMAHVPLPYGHLLIVADGMGGHTGGATASKMAVDTIAEFARSFNAAATRPDSFREMLWYALCEANSAVYGYAQAHPDLKGMGTTVVCALVVGDNVYVAHVGDSRLYYLNPLAGRVTSDHTTVQEMVDHSLISPEQAKSHPEAHKLLRAIGHKPEIEPEVRPEPVRLGPGDAVLLCSDGLYDVVSDDEIGQAVLIPAPQQACADLIRLANQRGGPDNITVIIYRRPGGKRRAYTTSIFRTGLRRWLGLPLYAWLALAAAAIAAALAVTLVSPDKPSDDKPAKDKDQPHQEAPESSSSKPSVHGAGLDDVLSAPASDDASDGAVQEDAASPPRDKHGVHNRVEQHPESPSNKVRFDEEKGPGSPAAPDDTGKERGADDGSAHEATPPKGIGACDPVKTDDLVARRQIEGFLRYAAKARGVLAQKKNEKFYVGEQHFRDAVGQLKGDTAQKACMNQRKQLAQECTRRRLDAIRAYATSNCEEACRLAHQALQLNNNDNVRERELLLDHGDASAALGKCLQDKAIKCDAVKRLGPTQETAPAVVQPTEGASDGLKETVLPGGKKGEADPPASPEPMDVKGASPDDDVKDPKEMTL